VPSVFAHFLSEEAARQFLEARRWPDGPFCPHCQRSGRCANEPALKLNRAPSSNTHGREGLHQCRVCRKQFTVTIGTILENSRIPLYKWLAAIHLMFSPEKAASAVRLQRELGLGSYRSASFLCRRLRWAMTQSPLVEALRVSNLARAPMAHSRIVDLLLAVTPTGKMPRPGTQRQKSVWAEVNDEMY
jgi:transposase-like protein